MHPPGGRAEAAARAVGTSLREPDSLSVFVLTNANPSAIHSDRRLVANSFNLQRGALLKMKSKRIALERR